MTEDKYNKTLEAVYELFAWDTTSVERWMNDKKAPLGGKSPSDLLKTDEGCDILAAYVKRIEYGVYQ